MDENITPKQPFNNRQIKHIKGALIMNLKNLKKLKNLDQRKNGKLLSQQKTTPKNKVEIDNLK